MSIKPPSDILLDVARAADPTKTAAATGRLQRLAVDAGVSEDEFSSVLGDVDTAAPAPASAPVPLPAIAEARFAAEPSQKAKDLAETKAYQGISALLLENLVDTMLPQGDEFFGSEAGADVWRSMLAQELGTSLSKRVDLGLGAKHIKAAHLHSGWEPGGVQASLTAIPLRSAKHS